MRIFAAKDQGASSHAIARAKWAVKKVPRRGLEPLRISPPDPKSGASANFATSAPLGSDNGSCRSAGTCAKGSLLGSMCFAQAPTLSCMRRSLWLCGIPAIAELPAFASAIEATTRSLAVRGDRRKGVRRFPLLVEDCVVVAWAVKYLRQH